jgi:DNA helicase II / ATP-dependent DNA helicase PcrA
MPLTPTPEQQAIIEAARSTQDNLLINALAGAAKTSTLVMIAHALPATPILSLAFNKRIAEEMKSRLPGTVMCKTLNAIGHGVWMQACGRRLVIDTKKSYTILKALIEALPRKEKSEAYETFAETLKLIGRAKLAGYIPGNSPMGQRLVTAEEFWDSLDDDADGVQRDLVDRALNESISQAYAGTIDFDDQIYMPTLFGGTFPRFPLVLVDEAQDLSLINHAMLDKLVVKRLIAVGDPFQSIYAFRGAMPSSMATLRHRFQMREMNLSVSFRCPRTIVERARFRAPHMQYPEWAVEGQINAPEIWTFDHIRDGGAVICRNNAPLFSLAFKLIRAGRGVTVVGSDIGPALVKALKKLGPEDMNNEACNKAIDTWLNERLARRKGEAAARDKADCLRVFVDIGGSLSGAIAYADSLFRQTGPIQLLSGHKSKGLEWDDVYHLDPWRIPSEWAHGPDEQEQELNIRYVIETRAKRSLTLIDMEALNV